MRLHNNWSYQAVFLLVSVIACHAMADELNSVNMQIHSTTLTDSPDEDDFVITDFIFESVCESPGFSLESSSWEDEENGIYQSYTCRGPEPQCPLNKHFAWNISLERVDNTILSATPAAGIEGEYHYFTADILRQHSYEYGCPIVVACLTPEENTPPGGASPGQEITYELGEGPHEGTVSFTCTYIWNEG